MANDDDAAAASSASATTTTTEYDDGYAQHVHEMEKESKESSSLYFILFSILLFAVLVMSKYLHEAPRLNKYLSEASLILMVGLIVSFLTETFIQYEIQNQPYYDDDDYFTSRKNDDDETDEDIAFQRLISFSPNIFFMALLPPILFNSGYQLRRELFLRHIYPIVMFAVMGTIVSSIVCAMMLWGLQQLNLFSKFDPTLLELFAFGSLIAATDTVSVIAVLQAKRVDPHLFYVVFGESALNDAVALVLFNSFADLLRANKQYSYEAFVAFFPEFLLDAVGSPLLGMAFGFGFALLFKTVDLRRKKYRMLELSLYLMLMYVPFIIAESTHLSGIVTIFFAGLSVRRYVAPNVSRVTEKAGATIFQLVAFLSETCIFLELGLSIFGFSGSFHWDFIVYSLLCCLIARAAAIYPLALLHNLSVAKEEQKSLSQLHINLSPSTEQQDKTMFAASMQNFYVPPSTAGDAGASKTQPVPPTTFGTTEQQQQHQGQQTRQRASPPPPPVVDVHLRTAASAAFGPPRQQARHPYLPPSEISATTTAAITTSEGEEAATSHPQQEQATTSRTSKPYVLLDAVMEDDDDDILDSPVQLLSEFPSASLSPDSATGAAAAEATSTLISTQPQHYSAARESDTAGQATPQAHNTHINAGTKTAAPRGATLMVVPHHQHPLMQHISLPRVPDPYRHHHHHQQQQQQQHHHHRRAPVNSFDTEDTRGSTTTATTHQSRKRRERRGRMMNNVKKERISWDMMHILWFAGLRGAVAYACVREFPNVHGNADEFAAATMFIVLFTIVVMGGLTETLLEWLGIEMGVDLEEYMDIFRQEQDDTGGFQDFERVYLYNLLTRKQEKPPTSTDSNASPTPSQQPPVFLGVDSNAFRSMPSVSDPEMLNWPGFEMQCFPGYSYYAAAYQGAYPSTTYATAIAKVNRTTLHHRVVAACEEARSAAGDDFSEYHSSTYGYASQSSPPGYASQQLPLGYTSHNLPPGYASQQELPNMT
ncbi:hypothetical protein ACA910_010618 [Epithemia clementina (nom. ined.)]